MLQKNNVFKLLRFFSFVAILVVLSHTESIARSHSSRYLFISLFFLLGFTLTVNTFHFNMWDFLPITILCTYLFIGNFIPVIIPKAFILFLMKTNAWLVLDTICGMMYGLLLTSYLKKHNQNEWLQIISRKIPRIFSFYFNYVKIGQRRW